jgi:hypothetical protein
VHWAPGIPCALCFMGERFLQDSDASRREIAESYFAIRRRHCEERKRRSNPFFLCAARWIASFVRHDGLLRFARNDGFKTGCLKSEVDI